jgi:Cupin superfamily protein
MLHPTYVGDGLGLACGRARSLGVALHVDAFDNFVIQIEGKKTWYLKRADELANIPTGSNSSYTFDDEGMAPWPLSASHILLQYPSHHRSKATA